MSICQHMFKSWCPFDDITSPASHKLIIPNMPRCFWDIFLRFKCLFRWNTDCWKRHQWGRSNTSNKQMGIDKSISTHFDVMLFLWTIGGSDQADAARCWDVISWHINNPQQPHTTATHHSRTLDLRQKGFFLRQAPRVESDNVPNDGDYMKKVKRLIRF